MPGTVDIAVVPAEVAIAAVAAALVIPPALFARINFAQVLFGRSKRKRRPLAPRLIHRRRVRHLFQKLPDMPAITPCREPFTLTKEYAR